MQPQRARDNYTAQLPMPDLESLTASEHKILRQIVQGCSNLAIAQQSFISVNTVKFHLKNIYNKLGVKSRTQAVLIYLAAASAEWPEMVNPGMKKPATEVLCTVRKARES